MMAPELPGSKEPLRQGQRVATWVVVVAGWRGAMMAKSE
jgi:hypothetical protein